MSHYTVAVLAHTDDDRTFDDLLTPYSESDSSFFENIPITEEEMDTLKQRYANSGSEDTFDQWIFAQGVIQLGGKYFYRYNPQAKWDWYTLDGSDALFDLTEEAVERYHNMENPPLRYRIHDYNYRPERGAIKRAQEFWDYYVLGKERPDDVPPQESFYKPEYFKKRYGTKKNYIRCAASIQRPYAFVTPDGVWHAPGTVGWFATDDATEDSLDSYMDEWEAIVKSDDNPFVSFVDCHI